MPGALKGRGYTERANVITGAPLNVGAQTPFSPQLPMGEGWYKAWMRFNFAVVIGTGAGAIAEGELLIIKNVLMRTDRSEVICNLPGRALYKIATYKTGTPLRKDPVAAASATYRVTLPIYFADEYMLRPEDTILNTGSYNSCSLQMTLGTVADLFTAPGTATVTATLDLEIERSLGVLPKEAEPLFHASYDFVPPVDASVNQFINLDRAPDMHLKRLYVHSGTGGTGGVAWSGANSDAVQQFASVKDQNRSIEKERQHLQILDVNKGDQSLESVLAGVEAFDFVRDRSISSAIVTGDKSLLQYIWTNQGGVAANSIVTATEEMIRTLK